MKRLLLAALLLVGCTEHKNVGVAPPRPRSSSEIEVHFSPNGGCEAAYVAHIDRSEKTVHIMAYTFTSKPIAEALIRAKSRGVTITVLADKKESIGRGTVLPLLSSTGIPVFVDGSHPIFHDKVGIFDSAVIGNGSFNLGASAEHLNSENCLFISDSGLVSDFEGHWSTHLAHSVRF